MLRVPSQQFLHPTSSESGGVVGNHMSFTNPPSIAPTALLASLFLNGTSLITDCIITVTDSSWLMGVVWGLGQENKSEKVWRDYGCRQPCPTPTVQGRS